jgi:phosphoserine aminotransferase
VVAEWVARTDWIDFLAAAPATRSCTSICLTMANPRPVVERLAELGVAYDIGSYRDAPPGLRLWGGATVETADLAALLPWLEWGWAGARD